MSFQGCRAWQRPSVHGRDPRPHRPCREPRAFRAVPEAMKARLRIDPALGGRRRRDERARLLDSGGEYRLLRGRGAGRVPAGRLRRRGMRVNPQDCRTRAGGKRRVREGPARVGFQLHVQPGPWLAPGPPTDPRRAARSKPSTTCPVHGDPAGRRNGGSLGRGTRARSSGRHPAHRGPRRRPPRREAIRRLHRAARSARRGMVGSSESRSSRRWTSPGTGGSASGSRRRERGPVQAPAPDDKGAATTTWPTNYAGWRLQQLARPEKEPDRLPAGSGACCSTQRPAGQDRGSPARSDDREALRALRPAPPSPIPGFEIGGKRLAW